MAREPLTKFRKRALDMGALDAKNHCRDEREDRPVGQAQVPVRLRRVRRDSDVPAVFADPGGNPSGGKLF